jgi:hypothetical protein
VTMHTRVLRSPVAHFRSLTSPYSSGCGDHGTARYLFGGLEVWLRPLMTAPVAVVELYWVGALRPGQGEGSAGMRGLVDLADIAGVELLLYADPWGRRGRMGRDALRCWYEHFGFRAVNTDLVPYWPRRLGLEMRRPPRRLGMRVSAV